MLFSDFLITFCCSSRAVLIKIDNNFKTIIDKGNYEKLNDYFNFINWNDVFCDLNANDSFYRWLSIYQYGCELFIPTLRTDNNKRIKEPLWMNMEIKRICKRKRDLWFLCRNSNFRNKMLVFEYKQLNSAVKKIVKRNIREFEQNLARNAKTNPKLVYRYINSKTKTMESIKAIYVNGFYINVECTAP